MGEPGLPSKLCTLSPGCKEADEAQNAIWVKNRKYKMGQKQKMHVEANAENTSGPQDESPYGGGRPI